jgi:hypothetical protein
MFPWRFSRPIRLGLYALASAILLALCVVPQDRLPDTGTGDKPEHAIAWFILTLTGYLLSPRRVWAIPAYALAFGGLIEVFQASMGFGRHGDWSDLGMDSLGIAGALAAFLLWRRWRAP